MQLTDGMAKLIGSQPFHGLRYEGRRFDCGDKLGYLEAQIAFALQRPGHGPRRARLPENLWLNRRCKKLSFLLGVEGGAKPLRLPRCA